MARSGESRRNCPDCIGGLRTRASASTDPRAADRRASSADDCARADNSASTDLGTSRRRWHDCVVVAGDEDDAV